MKVKVLSRNSDDYVRETKKDIHKGIFYCTPTLSFIHAKLLIEEWSASFRSDLILAIGAVSGSCAVSINTATAQRRTMA